MDMVCFGVSVVYWSLGMYSGVRVVTGRGLFQLDGMHSLGQKPSLVDILRKIFSPVLFMLFSGINEMEEF